MSEVQPGRPRRVRSVTEMLLSIVLVLEAIVVFFVTLTVYGLDLLPPVTAFASGGTVLVAMMVTAVLLRFRWGLWLGWALQLVLLASGILLPALYFVAAIFIAMWVYCFIRGGQIDRGNAARQ